MMSYKNFIGLLFVAALSTACRDGWPTNVEGRVVSATMNGEPVCLMVVGGSGLGNDDQVVIRAGGEGHQTTRTGKKPETRIEFVGSKEHVSAGVGDECPDIEEVEITREVNKILKTLSYECVIWLDGPNAKDKKFRCERENN